ncbi:Lsr2 family protein [Actinobacteria bacterium YIM 96077]|uniref:Lsr2 family protein n=1 Tax=Phytoactinopolyspora halophila TaxID=1981511 RepID=A0A329R0Y4_9ACTN|nr:Lsr2 family protein [Phytoactinopolyspora halophila]AYY11484.1 Lsr2 family protein [Actinobacteria bacterium YIM 96077]RAW18033.1 Lsr2 family protein [Phytoactinopolyspora halophila]
MAQKVQVILLDDLDGGEAEETVSFGLDGSSYEIDLSKENASQLREALAPYVASARKAGGAKRTRGRGKSSSSSRSSSSSSGTDTAAVREWARAQGLKVSDRGRIPADIMEKYEASRS